MQIRVDQMPWTLGIHFSDRDTGLFNWRGWHGSVFCFWVIILTISAPASFSLLMASQSPASVIRFSVASTPLNLDPRFATDKSTIKHGDKARDTQHSHALSSMKRRCPICPPLKHGCPIHAVLKNLRSQGSPLKLPPHFLDVTSNPNPRLIVDMYPGVVQQFSYRQSIAGT